jgi:hypothetical protein
LRNQPQRARHDVKVGKHGSIDFQLPLLDERWLELNFVLAN